MSDTSASSVPTLEDLIARAGLTGSAGELAADIGVDVATLRHLFDWSAHARAAAQGSANAALEMLSKLGGKAARAMKREVKLAEEAALAEARANDPLAQELDMAFADLDGELLACLDDMEFARDEEARALGYPWAPQPPGYRHPRYVPPPPAPKCGAKTRKGAPCIRTAQPNGRCRNHGGLSTGPRTTEGRERIAEAQRRRHAARAATA